MSNPASLASQRVPTSVPRPSCYLCGRSGKALYTGLSDRIWTVPGVWDVRVCPEQSCGLVWLDPCPVAEDIPLLYENYHTHDALAATAGSRLDRLKMRILANAPEFGQPNRGRMDVFAWMLARIGMVKDYAAGSILWLSPAWKGKLLDVGSGGCELLTRMRDRGWEVAGVEPDPKAREAGKSKHHLDIRLSVNEFPEQYFDVVTLSHVIEHLPDPIATLRECGKRLKRGGRLVVATPNAKSLGHKWFSSKWIILEPPRHLMLFSPQSLSTCLASAGFEVETTRTSSRPALYVWYGSQLLKAERAKTGAAISNSEASLSMKLIGIIFHVIEHQLVGKNLGEEVVAVAKWV